MAEATVTAGQKTAVQDTGGLPAPKPAEKTPGERLDELKKALDSNVAARARTIGRIAGLADGSQDKAFRERCADAIGSFLTAERTSTTDREHAARMLGTLNTPKAVDHLSTAVSDGQPDRLKYPTTVRTAAIQALIKVTGLPMVEAKTREAAMDAVRAVAEKDRYDPGREAKAFLARLEDIRKKSAK